MTTKILAPHYLCLELEISSDLAAVWRALTDLHELRAWWGQPVVGLQADVGGGFELRYPGHDRTDRFTFNTWDPDWRVGGQWTYNWLDGAVDEMLSLTGLNGRVRVSVEQTGFQTFGNDATRIFGYHKTEVKARLERLRNWCEQRIPATMAVLPAF